MGTRVGAQFGVLIEAIADILRGRRTTDEEIAELLTMDEFNEAGCELISEHGRPIGIHIPIRRGPAARRRGEDGGR
jgi:hypothetical protein